MRLSATTERRVLTVLPPLLVGLLALPFVLWQNSWWEWTTAFWLLERQAAHVSAHGVPTFFLHTDGGVFSPFYVFYGGFTFSVLAYPAAVIGAWPVFAASCAAAFVGGYLGIWWTARNLGLSHRLAILPALAFVTTPCLLSDLYGRAAWAELIGVNAVAVMLGGLTSLLWKPDRGRGRALAALAGSGAIVAGTHNLTLLLTALILPLILAALLPLAPRPAGVGALARQLGRGIVALALGAGLTGAWLIPNLWLGPSTNVTDPANNASAISDHAMFATVSNVLSPWPAIPSVMHGRSWLYTQAPVLASAWALVALVVVVWTRRRARDRTVTTAVALLAIGTALLVLVVNPGWWESFPRLLRTIQFPYRVVPYLAIAVALGIVVALGALTRGAGRRALIATLVAAIAAQAAMAAVLVINTKAYAIRPDLVRLRGDIQAGGQPPSFFVAQYQFRMVDRPTGPPARQSVSADVPDLASSDTAKLTGTGAVGQARATPLAWSPLVRVTGDAKIAGRTKDGNVVLAITRSDAAGRWHATARSACTLLCLNALSGGAPWQLLAGRLLTLLSAIALAACAVTLPRRRRSARPPVGSSVAVAAPDAPDRVRVTTS